MMIEMVGKKFNRLTVLELSHKMKRKPYWICKCDCGNTKVIEGYCLRVGSIKSCGCLYSMIKNHKTHGMSKTSTYRSWVHMHERCLVTKCKDYKNYGGRGITICKRWLNSFENFYEDMGEKPEGLTIERIDNDSNYKLSNCKWATRKEQNMNKRNTLTV